MIHFIVMYAIAVLITAAIAQADRAATHARLDSADLFDAFRQFDAEIRLGRVAVVPSRKQETGES
jgi:hypothetical protein